MFKRCGGNPLDLLNAWFFLHSLGCWARAAWAVCDMSPQESLFSPCTPKTRWHLHPPWRQPGVGGVSSCLCCDPLVLLAGSPCTGKASCQRISDQVFYIHPWCDHTSFREEASGMDLG